MVKVAGTPWVIGCFLLMMRIWLGCAGVQQRGNTQFGRSTASWMRPFSSRLNSCNWCGRASSGAFCQRILPLKFTSTFSRMPSGNCASASCAATSCIATMKGTAQCAECSTTKSSLPALTRSTISCDLASLMSRCRTWPQKISTSASLSDLVDRPCSGWLMLAEVTLSLGLFFR